MQTKILSNQALNIIHNYLHLPFSGHDINCPYFNNQRRKVHSGLRVLIGKGSADDIIEEAQIIARRDKINLSTLTNEELKQFLVKNNIGLDCSALIYYIFNAEISARGLGSLKKNLKFPFAKNPLRKLLTKLRPIENVGVNTLAHESNSYEVPLCEVQPGDMIILLKTGHEHKLNHVLLVHKVDRNTGPSFPRRGEREVYIHYTHSFKWRSDGKYNHGVRQGIITIVDPKKPLVEQVWEEQGKRGEENGTMEHAKLAEGVLIRRLNII